MKRRVFLKGLLALPVMAALPLSLSPVETVTKDTLHVKFDYAETRFKSTQVSGGGYLVDKKTASEIIKKTFELPFIIRG